MKAPRAAWAFVLEDVVPYVALDLSPWEVYGLFFLLGSFAVATLSDLKTMTAQREFMDVWWIFAAAMLLVQLLAHDGALSGPFLAKWGLIAGFGLLCWRAIGLWLRLAIADVAAVVAAAALLSPGLVVVYFVLLKLLAWPAAKLLARGKPAYPFMPVVTLATVGILMGALWAGVVDA